ncbi:hypothetical protein [Streptosporangium sp. NPDC002607]
MSRTVPLGSTIVIDSRVRSWLTPAIALARWWRSWSQAVPPAELQQLLDAVGAGHGLRLYLPP